MRRVGVTLTAWPLLFFFIIFNVGPVCAQAVVLPPPGEAVGLSQPFAPCLMTGVRFYPQDPFRFDFIVDPGDTGLSGPSLKDESTKLVKYFLATLTTPATDLWVNLSPYEKGRVIPEFFGLTEMGRDLLAQDYTLKQLSSSLLAPDTALGKAFWSKVYAKAQELYGSTDVPVDTFNKVWIMPDAADIVVKNGTAVIVRSRMKLMLDVDYVALKEAQAAGTSAAGKDTLSTDVMREVILPALEKEVNEGKNFAAVRQVYSALILATWLKRKIIKDGAGLSTYVDGNKVAGVDHGEKAAAQHIWEQYVASFKKGTVNLVREEQDEFSGELIPRKYFSGGALFSSVNPSEVTGEVPSRSVTEISFKIDAVRPGRDHAMAFAGALEFSGQALSVRQENSARFSVEALDPENRRSLVYKITDNVEGRSWVMRSARTDTDVPEDLDQTRRNHDILGPLEITPNVVADDIVVGSARFLVVEALNGLNYFQMAQQDQGIPEEAIKAMADLMVRMVKAGVFVGDHHLKNFVYEPGKGARMVDTEAVEYHPGLAPVELMNIWATYLNFWFDTGLSAEKMSQVHRLFDAVTKRLVEAFPSAGEEKAAPRELKENEYLVPLEMKKEGALVAELLKVLRAEYDKVEKWLNAKGTLNAEEIQEMQGNAAPFVETIKGWFITEKARIERIKPETREAASKEQQEFFRLALQHTITAGALKWHGYVVPNDRPEYSNGERAALAHNWEIVNGSQFLAMAGVGDDAKTREFLAHFEERLRNDLVLLEKIASSEAVTIVPSDERPGEFFIHPLLFPKDAVKSAEPAPVQLARNQPQVLMPKKLIILDTESELVGQGNSAGIYSDPMDPNNLFRVSQMIFKLEADMKSKFLLGIKELAAVEREKNRMEEAFTNKGSRVPKMNGFSGYAKGSHPYIQVEKIYGRDWEKILHEGAGEQDWVSLEDFFREIVNERFVLKDPFPANLMNGNTALGRKNQTWVVDPEGYVREPDSDGTTIARQMLDRFRMLKAHWGEDALARIEAMFERIVPGVSMNASQATEKVVPDKLLEKADLLIAVYELEPIVDKIVQAMSSIINGDKGWNDLESLQAAIKNAKREVADFELRQAMRKVTVAGQKPEVKTVDVLLKEILTRAGRTSNGVLLRAFQNGLNEKMMGRADGFEPTLMDVNNGLQVWTSIEYFIDPQVPLVETMLDLRKHLGLDRFQMVHKFLLAMDHALVSNEKLPLSLAVNGKKFEMVYVDFDAMLNNRQNPAEYKMEKLPPQEMARAWAKWKRARSGSVALERQPSDQIWKSADGLTQAVNDGTIASWKQVGVMPSNAGADRAILEGPDGSRVIRKYTMTDNEDALLHLAQDKPASVVPFAYDPRTHAIYEMDLSTMKYQSFEAVRHNVANRRDEKIFLQGDRWLGKALHPNEQTLFYHGHLDDSNIMVLLDERGQVVDLKIIDLKVLKQVSPAEALEFDRINKGGAVGTLSHVGWEMLAFGDNNFRGAEISGVMFSLPNLLDLKEGSFEGASFTNVYFNQVDPGDRARLVKALKKAAKLENVKIDDEIVSLDHSEQVKQGGIDFNPAGLAIKEDVASTDQPRFNLQGVPAAGDILGYQPVLLEIKPVADLRAFVNGPALGGQP
ncbi:MAG: hypothetical protein WCO69_04695 [Candidatus Omnitrophota bacterium]